MFTGNFKSKYAANMYKTLNETKDKNTEHFEELTRSILSVNRQKLAVTDAAIINTPVSTDIYLYTEARVRAYYR